MLTIGPIYQTNGDRNNQDLEDELNELIYLDEDLEKIEPLELSTLSIFVMTCAIILLIVLTIILLNYLFCTGDSSEMSFRFWQFWSGFKKKMVF